MKLSTERIPEFANYLCQEEKSTATQEKYLSDVRRFCMYADGNQISKELIMAWKKESYRERLCSTIHQLYAGQREQLVRLSEFVCLQGEEYSYATEDLLCGR